MSESNEIAVSNPSGEIQHELAEFKDTWWWFLLLGVLLVICGIVAISYPFFASISVVIVLGTVMLIAGIATIISSFWTGTWSAFLIQLFIGILYTVLGFLITEAPAEATGALTLLVAAMFIVAGIFRMVAAITLQFPQWGWVLLNGAFSLILGVLIYKHFPESALWLIGLMFGIDLLFNGFSWIALALDVRRTKVTDETP